MWFSSVGFFFTLRFIFYLWCLWVFIAACPGCSVVVVYGLLMKWPLLWSTDTGLMDFSSCTWWALEHGCSSWGMGPRCPKACRIFWDQGWDLCLLHCLLTTEPPGKPQFCFLINKIYILSSILLQRQSHCFNLIPYICILKTNFFF